MAINLQGSAGDFGNVVAAISALGTAAFGLVDATKVFRGGVSNIGFNFIRAAIQPYVAALRLVDRDDPFRTIKANWLNGVAKADQKAAVKSLIRLGLTSSTAASIAGGAPGIDAAQLAAVASKIDAGAGLDEAEITLLGRFDAIVDAQMDAGFERADQKYRNAAKVLAALIAIVLAFVGVWVIERDDVGGRDFVLAFFIGLISTPLAPVAKDITSAVGAAVSALKATKG
jgi:hypothetical protein